MARLATLSPRLGTLDTRTARPAPKVADPELLTPEHKAWRQEVLKRAGWKCQAPGCTAHGRRGGVRLTLRNSDDIDDATAAAITEISQTKDGALKVKLADRRAALVDIGRHLGMFRTGSAPSDESGDGQGKPPAGKSSGDEGWDGLLQ